MKDGVSVLATFVRKQVIRLIEVAIVDGISGNEVGHLHAPILFDRRGFEVLFREDHVAATFVLVAFDEIFPRHRCAITLADALVLDRRSILRVKQPELRTILANRGMELNWNSDETERQASAP